MKFEIGLVLFCALGMVAFVVAFTGVAPPFVFTATRYAPAYSEKGFQSIKVGDSREKVLQILGKPFWDQKYEAGTAILNYSEKSWALWFYRRMITLSNDVVTEKISLSDYD
jgi:hypothetical protein